MKKLVGHQLVEIYLIDRALVSLRAASSNALPPLRWIIGTEADTSMSLKRCSMAISSKAARRRAPTG